MTTDTDREALAAEYVLGTLDRTERAEAQAMIELDPGFAALVRGWERRLGELSAMINSVEPPEETWTRVKGRVAGVPQLAPLAPVTLAPVEAAKSAAPSPAAPPPVPSAPVAPMVQPAPAVAVPSPGPSAAPAPPAAPGAEIIRLERRVGRWQRATVLIGALAACLVGVVALREFNPTVLPEALRPKPKIIEITHTVEVPAPRPAEFVAVLQKDAFSPAFVLTVDVEKRTFTVRAVGAERQAGKSYELWLVAAKYGNTPRSLGVVGADQFTVRPAAAEYDPVTLNRATYAISLEPEGGSPTGKPTQVLFTGTLLQTTPPTVGGSTTP